MKKLITKFWGVGLVIILLSTLFVGTAAPAAAADYAFANTFSVPGTFPTDTTLSPAALPSFGIRSADQSGSTIYALASNGTLPLYSSYLYKSADAGATWGRATAAGLPSMNVTMVAVAPDDPTIVAATYNGTTAGAADTVYVSVNGGASFGLIAAPAAGEINSIAVSPLSAYRYIAIGTSTGKVLYWTFNALQAGWVNISPVTVWKVYAVAFSPNFAADAGLIAVTANSSVATSVYNFNALRWNTPGSDFPRTLITGNATAKKATITLDPNFYLGDPTTQIGFISIASANATFGGVFRFDVASTGLLTEIYGSATTPIAVNSVAWDGTNLIVAPYTIVAADNAIIVQRCANATAGAGWAFLPSSQFKTPGTGTYPIVMFNGANAFAFSRGTNSAVAKSTDLGKSWDGIALVNSNFNTIDDLYVSPDGTMSLATVNDGTDINLWARNGFTWQRILVDDKAGAAGQVWLVRAAMDGSDTIYLGLKGGNVMYKSLDGGASWITRSTTATIADFAVQDANTIFMVSPVSNFVYKSINGALIWTPLLSNLVGGFGRSITAIDVNQVLIGTTTGGVAYTTDGAAFTAIPAPVSGGNLTLTATGLTAGSNIWVGSEIQGAVAGGVHTWTIGTSLAWTDSAAANVTGVTLQNGVLYAISNGGKTLFRYLSPTIFGALAPPFAFDVMAIAGNPVINQATTVNTLRSSTGNAVWAVAQAAIDQIWSYTDSLISQADSPTLVAPAIGSKISVNSLNGAVNAFVFQWNAPAFLPTAPAQTYTYTVRVFLDEARTIAVATAVGQAAGTGAGGVVANLSSASPAWGIGGLALVPGNTYWWDVQVDSPVHSAFSPLSYFTVQQLQSVVPTIGSPTIGQVLAQGQQPAFSWSPIADALTYMFDVSTDPSFATTIYSTTTTSAGAVLPSSVKLTAGTTYFWRVKALTPTEGDYSTVGNFTVAAAVTPPPTSSAITPVTTVITIPAPITTVITVPQATTVENTVNPSYIWAIIIIGAVLVIAVIVLIVRTRRSV